MKNFKNLYEITKTVRFELKPSIKTSEKIKSVDLFKTPSSQSKIFTQEIRDGNNEAGKNEKNYIFYINELELNNLVKRCDEKIEEVRKVKGFLENNSDKLWQIWIDNEKIKIIDKDLKYILQEKKSWNKSFWNETKKQLSNYTVEWKKGLFLTLDDVDAYFEKTRSTENSERETGKFTVKVIERLDFLLKQYNIRKLQLLLNTRGDTKQNEKKLFQTKKERVARIRSFLGIFLQLERVISLFNYEYEDSFCEFPEDLKTVLEDYHNNVKDIISEIETVFAESNLYLHQNIARKFTLNIRAINPRPENIDKTTNQVKTEDEIQEKIEKIEEKISKLKNEKAKLKGERKEKGKSYKNDEWNNILRQLNPSEEASPFSQLAKLRRDLEEVHITHFSVLLEREGLFYLALENKRVGNGQNGSIKKISEFKLMSCFEESIQGEGRLLDYKNITFKALRRLCLEKTSSMRTKNFLDLDNTDWAEYTGQGGRLRKVSKNWQEEKYFDDLKNYLQKILKNKAGKIGVKFTDDDFQEWDSIKWDKDLKNLSTIIDKRGYKATWKNFNWEKLETLEKDTEIEIFQIYNKDFLIDPNFAVSLKDKEKMERVEFTKKQFKKEGKEFIPKYKDSEKRKKQNLYTIYWQDFFINSSGAEYRIKPEGKFYVRLAGDGDNGQKKLFDINKKEFKQARKARFAENKILADFNLWINPTIDKVQSKVRKKSEVKNHIDEVNKLHKNDETDFYILGLDRGLNSLVSYGVFDSDLNIVQIDESGNFHETKDKKYDNRFDFVCGDWSLVNSKGRFVKRENCRFNDRKDLKDFTISIFKQLKMFYEFEKNNDFGVDKYVEQFEEDDFGNKYLEYGNDKQKIRFYILKERNEDGESFEIREVKRNIIKGIDNKPLLDKNNEKQFEEVEDKIWTVDENGNKVFDYVLSFYSEKAKRIFILKKQQDLDSELKPSKEEVEEFLLESVDELKEGFTGFVVGEIVRIIRNIAEQKNKKLYIVFEDLINYGNKDMLGNIDESFADIEHDRNLSVLVYQKLESNLIKKFNYLQTKYDNSEINKTQFSPQMQADDIKKFQKQNDKGGQLGNLIFVDPENTSKQCPECSHSENANREKKNALLDYIDCQKCDFSTKESRDKKGFDFIDGGDTLAAYNIARRGLEFIRVNKKNESKVD